MWIGKLDSTPLGKIWVARSPDGLVAVNLWGNEGHFIEQVARLTGASPQFAQEKVTAVLTQFQAYFDKDQTEFDLPIDWSVMTDFQETAMRAVCEVPYGRYVTYKDIATRIGKPKAARAVGRANATNPMPIIIPCHRILGSDGKLHGYSAPGGLETKAWLLRHEGSWLL
ncbi:MAG: methylated-DNA--[protein]-cysteine S-methyltransferase [Chloroflexi bacterium]|nr:methylated-DNA--[protein]-cysteine S-methyltransferase [Chloroflexota bacterium]